MEESTEVDAWIGKQYMFPALLDKINLFLGEGNFLNSASDVIVRHAAVKSGVNL